MHWLLTILFFASSLSGFSQRRIEVNVNSSQPAELFAKAGTDLVITGSDLTLGDNPAAIGGIEPYSYQWLPETDLNDATQPNPSYSGNVVQSFTLIVTDNRGCLSRDTINIELGVYLNSISDDNVLLIYPNPGLGMVRLEMQGKKGGLGQTVSLMNANGKLLYTGKWENQDEHFLIDVSNLSGGTYFVRVGEGKESIARKLIITRK
jgi:hypothetical protein